MFLPMSDTTKSLKGRSLKMSLPTFSKLLLIVYASSYFMCHTPNSLVMRNIKQMALSPSPRSSHFTMFQPMSDTPKLVKGWIDKQMVLPPLS